MGTELLNKLSDGSSPALSPAATRSHAPDKRDKGMARVLVVEDNVITQLVTLQQLRELGCVPRTASSGVAALEAMRDQHFDLILLDCRMPDFDGYETARAIRTFEESEARQRAAIVAITGDSDVECVDKCLSAGMDGHLSKPTSIAGLRAIFERFLS